MDLEQDDAWLVFKLRGQLYAVPVAGVRRMLAMPPALPWPEMPPAVRGVIRLHQEVLPLVDLRQVLGLGSSLDGIQALLDKLNTLENEEWDLVSGVGQALEESRAPELDLDPANCPFGIWHAGFRAQRSIYLAGALRNFRRPHTELHRALAAVAELAAQGAWDQARARLEAARQGPLSRMELIFEQVRNLVTETHREIAVVFLHQRQSLAVAVDEVVAVEPVEAEAAGEGVAAWDRLSPAGRRYLTGVGRRPGEADLVLLLDLAHLFQELPASPASLA